MFNFLKTFCEYHNFTFVNYKGCAGIWHDNVMALGMDIAAYIIEHERDPYLMDDLCEGYYIDKQTIPNIIYWPDIEWESEDV